MLSTLPKNLQQIIIFIFGHWGSGLTFPRCWKLCLYFFKLLLRVWSIHLSSTIFISYELLLRELQNNMILSVMISIYFHAVDKNTTIFKSRSAWVKPIRHFVAVQLSQFCSVHFFTHAGDSSYQYLVLVRLFYLPVCIYWLIFSGFICWH